MTDHKLPDAVNNRLLFSDYYLQSLITEQSQWAETPNLQSVYAQMKTRYEAIKATAENLGEAQTERQFIQPVLSLLGHAFEVQPTLHTSQGPKRPDYAFFADVDALDAAQPQINTNTFFKTAIAIGDAKAWARHLDQKAQGRGDPFTNQNPSYQIDFYLRETDKRWGILTNGRQWRLYHRQTSYRLDHFYQVDLAALLSHSDAPDLEAFRYFYCLFRHDAFLLGAEGKCFLDRVLEGSQQYSVGISDRLKEQVYEALRLLIDGFLKYPRNHFETSHPPLQEIHPNSLILLYRILFILYAESRRLLPVENPDYDAQYSFTHLATEIHQKLEGGRNISSQTSIYWARLLALFQLINEGWEDRIPQYNGGLFNPEHHPFLEKYQIGDEALAKVIHRLTWTEQGERIVYRDLEVRHLGSIYEGLLEYQPRYAPEDMVIVSQKKGETVEPSSAHPNRDVAYRAGEVYLETDKGERKATGSYYTPDYIVRYIVENTLAPLCKGKSVDAILKLKVLDPAIGSGHFLVGAVDYLAEELATHPDAPSMTDGDSDTEIAYWRRRVVESCIYGVDVNPMAVELAKLSLWLHTVARGEPLSFLDHHIRCGNSLIGAKINDLSNLPALKKSKHKTNEGQLEAIMPYPFTATVARAIGHYLLIETTESRTADQVHVKEHELDIAQTMLRHHKGVANLWTSVYFGNEVSRSAYHQALNALRLGNTSELENLLSYQRAQKIAAEKRFFHWEIEFPEVCRDRYGREKENPGFDAVVGNPPWGANFGSLEQRYYSRRFYTGQASQIDSYALFTEQAVKYSRCGGQFGYITPDTGMRKDDRFYGRDVLFSETAIQQFVETGPLFPEVRDTWCLITLAERSNGIPGDHQIRHLQISRFIVSPEERLSLFSESRFSRDTLVRQSYWCNRPRRVIGYLSSEREQRVITMIENRSTRLGDLKDKFLISRGEEGSKSNVRKTESATWRLVLPEHVERYFVDAGVNILHDALTTGKVNGFYSHPKIWVIRIQKLRWLQRLVAGYDERKTSGGMKTLQVIVSTDDNLNVLKFLTALICSKLMNFWCTNYLVDDMNQTYLEKLPIRRINFTTPAAERDHLRENGKTLYELCLSEGSIDCVLGFVKHHLSTVPERSDVIHDLLALLAEQMIEMNQAKGEEIRGFLRWLEREIRVPMDTLQNKTAIQNYYEKELTNLMDVLKANRRAIGVDASGRDFQERLEREFNTSVGKLKPLMDRIKKTDELIDQIVYPLYGLTEEEIAIVEQTNVRAFDTGGK